MSEANGHAEKNAVASQPKKKRQGYVNVREYNKRVRKVCEMLALRFPDSRILDILTSPEPLGFGVHHSTAKRYLEEALQVLHSKARREDEENLLTHLAKSIALLEQIINDPEANHSTKMQAQRDLAMLLGLNAPAKVAQTTVAGDDIFDLQHVMSLCSEEELQVLVRIRQRLLNPPALTVAHTEPEPTAADADLADSA